MAHVPFLRAMMNKGKSGHEHILYIREDGQGITSIDNDHQHPVVPILNDEGEIVGIELGEADGHTHEIGDLPLKPVKKDTMSDDDKVSEALALYDAALKLEAEYRDQHKESEQFVLGDQWSSQDKLALKKKKRACLTINELQPKVDALVGFQRQNRTDIRFSPVEEGDATIAEILNRLVKNITEQSNYEYEESMAFEDEVIGGRGNIYPYIDHESNIEGDIRLEKFNWQDVVYGPHDKLDGADCEYVVKQKWLSKAHITKLYPNKKDELEESFAALSQIKDVGMKNADYRLNADPTVMKIFSENFTDLIDLEKKSFRILELNKKEYTRVPVLIRIEDSFFFDAERLLPEDVKRITTIDGFVKVEKVKSSVKVTKISGSVLLEDFDSIFSSLPMVPIYAKKKGQIILGKVEMAKDVQREINKRHSHFTDIINKMAGYGWIYEKGAFSATQYKKFLKDKGTPGSSIEVMDMNKIQKDQGVKFPNEVVALETLSSQKMQEVMGVNAELLGFAASAASGIAQVEQKRQSLIVNEFLFDNLSLSKKRIGKLLVEAISALYTPQRVSRIIMNSNRQLDEQGVPNNILAQYTADDIASIWLNADLTRYDVVVTENIHTATNRQANFRIWAEFLQLMPDQVKIAAIEFMTKLSDVPGKDVFLQQVTQMQQSQAQSEQGKQETEKQKVILSKLEREDIIRLGLLGGNPQNGEGDNLNIPQ
jgi:hypothetical protein